MDVYERRRQMQKAWRENAKQCEWRGDITMEEVMQHRTPKDCWVILQGYVYDWTQYVYNHPGGSSHFLGKNPDITMAFNNFHRGMDVAFVEKLKIGKFVPSKPAQ